MELKKKIFLILSLVLWINSALPSILTDTLVKTLAGYVTTEDITIGDILVSYDHISSSIVTITHIAHSNTDTLIAITTHKGTFCICPDQQFFDPVMQQWIAAENLTKQNILLDAQLHHCPCLDVKTIHIAPTTTYSISTTSPHTFFITEQELLTHNTLPIIVVGLAWLFGEGIKFAGLSLGAAALGSYIGVNLYNKHKQAQAEFDISLQVDTFGGYNPDPNDDKNKERKFNTITKSEFFKKVKNDYEHYKNGVYRRKKGAKGIDKAEYLEWDHLHGDVEAYTKSCKHLGSIDPRTLRIYKGAQPRALSF